MATEVKFTADRQPLVLTLLREGPAATVELLEKVIGSMPPELQDGVLMKGGQEQLIRYASVVVATLIFYTIMYNIIHRILYLIDDEKYTKRNVSEQDRYLNCWTSLLCMIIICSMSFYVHMYERTPENEYFGWWISNTTVLRVSDWHGYITMYMIGYFLFDEIVMHFKWADMYYEGDQVSVQMGVHHILGIVYMITGLTVGYCLPIGLCIAFITESSSIFLNLRQIHERRDTYYYVFVSVLFFIFFTLTRMLLIPYGFMLTLSVIIGTWERMNTLRRVCAVINLSMGVGVVAMQFFWYQFIVKSMLRMAGILPESTSSMKKKTDAADKNN